MDASLTEFGGGRRGGEEERERDERERRGREKRVRNENMFVAAPPLKKKNHPHLLDVLHDAADRDVTVLVAERVDVDLVGAVEVLFFLG